MTRGRLGLLLLFLGAFALRALCALEYTRAHPQADQPVIDEASYERWALEIAGGEWLGDEVFFQEPLYPYWLGAVYALFGHERLAVRLLQCGLGALTCLLVALLARRVFDARAGWLAGGLMALHRPAVLMPSLLLKPNLFLPLLTLLALGVVSTSSGRARRWLGLGVLGGLGALLRGNMLILCPALVCWPLVGAGLAREPWRRALASCAAALAGVALVLGPVALRNEAVGGVLALTTSGAGTNLYGGNSPENPYGVATELDFVRGVPEHEADDWRREAERRLGRPLDRGEVSRYWMGETWRSVREQPGAHLAILWRKLRLSLGVHEVPDNHSLAWDATYVAVLRWPLPGFGVLGSLGLAGLVVSLLGMARARRTRRAPLQLASWFALYLATIVLTVTSMRARLPLVPLLAPFAGAWLVWGRGAFAERRGRDALGLLLALAATGALVWTPVLPAGHEAREVASRDYNLAVQLLEREDRPADALPIARELVARDPANPRFVTLLASIEWRLGVEASRAGREAEGRELVRAALARVEPFVAAEGTTPRERARAARLAGWIQLDLGDLAAAERHFRRAREFAPDDPELVLEHARALLRLAERAPPGPERARMAAELTALLEPLPAPGDPDRKAEVRRLRSRAARL